MNRSVLSVLCSAVFLVSVAGPAAAATIPISIYVAPDNSYQNTVNNPCVFYGPGACPADPSGWPAPAGDTNGDVTTALTQSYTGASLTTFTDVVGTAFILGLDINDTSTAQTLNPFTLTFFNGSTVLLQYAIAATSVPSGSNGSGYADFILAAGCSGTVTDLGAIDSCSSYQPFVTPIGTTQISMTFGFSGTGNDGPDKVFAISGVPGDEPFPEVDPVPEPASVLLLGTGLAGLVAYRHRNRSR